jgi:hypothetical protein
LFYLVPLGPDDGIVDVAAPEVFDISGQTLYQQTITEFEWEAGMLYQLRQKKCSSFSSTVVGRCCQILFGIAMTGMWL